MIKIEKGEIYRAVRARSGDGDKGPWELVAVADERNEKRTITIFVSNAITNIHEGQRFKVKEIVNVKYGWKQDRTGNWRPDTTISAVIEPIASELGTFDGDDMGGPSPWDSEDWGQLPL